MRSEETKLRTEPAALWALLSAVILIIAFGIGYSLLREARPPHGAAVRSFAPATAGLAAAMVQPDPASSLSPWTGFGVFCLYAAVLLTFAALRMRRGDA